MCPLKNEQPYNNMTFGKFVKIAILTIAALLVAAGTFLFFWYRSGELQKTVVTKVGQTFLQIDVNNPPPVSANGEKISPISETVGANFVQKFFGLEEPQTYLVLFLNNTELRPAGGFIGTYAVITMDKANPQIIKVEGTEIIDNLAPKDFPSVPPKPITEYLGLERWYFRDSNWSPDFSTAAAKSLDLYRKEKGVKAEEIDAVIGFTPTVIEDLLRITGPVKAGGVEFTAANFTEKMEYEVEYGFANKGVSFNERKKMLSELTKAVVANAAKGVFTHWGDYKGLVEKMLEQKQIMMYSPNQDYQHVFEAKNWAGEMSGVPYDYLMWVDANLGALKTDASINRELSYEIYKDNAGKYVGRAKMKLTHIGRFDWRTSRYRDYARVYVPAGSVFLRASGTMKTDKSTEPRPVDQGIENGKQWFGSFISVEPGKVGEISFEYYLAPEVVLRLEANDYRLYVQKQLGTNKVRLTLGLNFANKLAYASPGEESKKHGDNRFDFSTILQKDLEFEIRTK